MQDGIKCPSWVYLVVFSLTLTLSSSAQFSLSFDGHLGEGSMSDTLLISGDSIALPTPLFSYFGHHFTSWNLQADGSGTSYFPNDSFAIATLDTLLYAQWGRYCGGSGTAIDPWTICDAEALILLSQSPQDWGAHFLQTATVSFSNDEASVDWDGDGVLGSFKDPAGFSPIGNTVQAFTGHYDGQGFRIDSLYTQNTNDFTGLFGIADAAVIQNVTLNQAKINGFNYIGGIVGRAQNSTQLTHLFFDGEVVGRAFVGGLLGSLENSELKSSSFMGTLKAGGSMAGGLVGRISASTVLNSYSAGYVLGELQNVGGIAGFVQDNTTIKNCFSTAGVKGLKYVGSFAGILSGSTVSNSYASGVAYGDAFAGGFVGVNGSSVLSDCYYDSETTWHQGSAPGLKPSKKNGFKDYAANFLAWDFGNDEANPWVQSPDGRPYLYWQAVVVSNALMHNTDSGYVFLDAKVEDKTTTTIEVGIRYKKENDEEWIYQLDSASSGTIAMTIGGLVKDDYWVQPFARNGVYSYYGDMTRMVLRTLSFDANGGTGLMADTLISSQDSIDLLPNPFLLSGYEFLEWNTAADSSGVTFQDQGTFAIGASDTMLYAIWTARGFSINYILDGGVNALSNPSTYTVDSLIVFEAPTRTGHSFGGWFAEDTFITRVDSILLNSKEDTSLYAMWDINSYDIVYHANNGSGLSTLETDTFGEVISLATHTFETANQNFKYWTTQADESGTVYSENDSYTYGDSTLHLYAQWQKYCGGYGTTSSPWEICSVEALILLSQSSEDWDNHFVQTADIMFGDSTLLVDWNGDSLANDSDGFLPLGSIATPFSGNYNGANYTIENLYINRPLMDNVALFGYATSDTIKQVALVNVHVNGRDNTAALIGYSEVDTLFNCYSNGLVLGRDNVGGLIGQTTGGVIKNSYSTCGVVGVQGAGGLLGAAMNSSLENNYSTGAIMALTNAGGLVGNALTSSFTSCYFDVQTSMQSVGTGSGNVAGVSALLTGEFKFTTNFSGWNIGIGIELLPWMPSDGGRPYLRGQKSSVSNGKVRNDYGGYTLSEAYADSVVYAPTSTGIRYKGTPDSLWTSLLQNGGSGFISNHFSGLNVGDYWVQSLSQKGDSLTYGDMTHMTLQTLHFEANGGAGMMSDTLLVVGDSIIFPRCTFSDNGNVHASWTTEADGSGFSFSPKGEFAIGNSDSTLYAQWLTPFATDDYFDGIVGGSRVELDITLNDTIGGVPYGAIFPIAIIETGTSGTVTIEGNQVFYEPPLTFSGPDFFTYLVDYDGAVDTAEVVILVFDAPGNMVNADCFVQMPKYEWEVNSAGQDPDGDIHDWTTPLVGDLFGDEYPEVVAVRGASSITDDDIVIYNGGANPLQNGRVEINNVPDFNAAATTMAIAKIETSSGLQPTLFLSAVDRFLYAFDPQIGNATPLWSSSETYCEDLGNAAGAFIGVADFNNDNQQEVYAANRIYNAATGDLLCSGSDSTDIGHFVYAYSNSGDYSDPTHHMMHTVTGDFDGDGDLELAAGRYVFDVDINNGVMPIMSRLPDSLSSDTNMIEDGPTVVADIDLDGDLDVIVTHQTTNYDFYCYVWDGQTPTLIAEKYIRNDFANNQRHAVGVPFVGDLNGDGKPEIAFTTSNRQYAFSYSDTSTELQEYYTLVHTDKSGFTGLTLFDFNNDDIAEIVYRDETVLRIINASGISHTTGNDTLNGDGTPILYNLVTYPCESGTQSEFAVVVDIDLDDQAEIIVTNNSSGHHLNIFESGANSKWVGARPVWNQYGYNVTNVNNDLTIPTYAINNSMAIEVDSVTTVRPFNHFLQQMGNVTLTGENVILTPDLYMSNSFYTNDGTTGTLTFDIINQGDADYDQEDSTVSFYCGDPETGGTLLSVDDIRADIAWEDTLKSQVYTFPADPTTCPRIYVRLNDNGRTAFPDSLRMQQECNYDNNSMLAAIFEVTSHFTWNGYDLDAVMLNTGDSSDVDGMAYMLISRGDTLDILPELSGYLFKPTLSSLPGYTIHNDTLTLENVQENGTVDFTAYKIPQVDITPKSVVYNQALHGGDVSVTTGVTYATYYKNNLDTLWTVDRPDSVGYYDIKVVCVGNYLYAASVDSLDSVLVVTPRPVSFSLGIDDKFYDGSDSVVSFTSTHDALSGDDVVLDTDNSDLHFANTNAGVYDVFPSGGWSVSGEDAHNYVIQPYDTVMATINKHLLTITANDSLKLYDGSGFQGGNGITCEGFALGEDTSILIGNLNYIPTASAQGALEKGIYTISIDGFSSSNYDVVYEEGRLTVEKKFLFIEFKGGAVITYGDSINLMDYTVPNVVNLAVGDSFVNQELAFLGDISTTGNLEAGVHKLNLGEAFVHNALGDTVTSNYDVSFSPENITVLPKEVYIANAIAQSKIYDANTDADISGAILSGLIAGDNVVLSNFSVGQFIQRDVGTAIEVFHGNSINISGLDADNYVLMPFNTSLFADIYPRELTISGTTAEDKLYDGDSAAVVRGALLHGVLGADDVYLLNDSAGIFEQAIVGSSLEVNTAITIGGTKNHNYYLTQNTGLVADITPAPLFISAVDTSKTYDAFTFSGGNGITWSGFALGEDTTDLSGSLSFVGSSQSAVDTGHYEITPQGFTASNYTISYGSDTLTVWPRIINIDYHGQDTIKYGHGVDWLDYNPTITDLAIGDTFLIDFIGFDNDTSNSGHLNVGHRALTSGETQILNATKDTVTYNYIFSFNPQYLTVLPQELMVVNAVAQDKTYDNTLLALIDSADLDSVILGDDVSLISATTGQFADENVAENSIVTPDSMSLGGSDRFNYTLLQSPPLLADILKRPIAYTLDSIADKVYDAADSLINIVGATTNDTILADSITLHYDLSFADANADSNISIEADTWFITGLDTANYLLLPYHGDSANIMPKGLIISANDTTKIYDGIPFVGGNGIVWSGFVAGEDTADLDGALIYEGSSQGATDTAYYIIQPAGYFANNYDINYKGDSLRIDPRVMSVNYGGADTIIYGDTINMFNYSPVTTDLALADTFKVSSLGFGTDTSLSGQLVVGEHALEIGDAYILNAAQDTVTHNYIFTFNPPSLVVEKKVIAVISAVAQDKIYDNTLEAVIDSAALDSVLTGDDVALIGAITGQFADENVAENIMVTPDLMSLAGSDRDNYTLLQSPSLLADILKRPIAYTLDSITDKVYDGTDSLVNSIAAVTTDTILVDSIILHYDLSFTTKDADSNITIEADTWFITGLDTANYLLLPYHGDSATIRPKELLIAANDTTKIYDGIPFIGGNGITWDGFIAGEDTSDLSGALSYGGTSQGATDTAYYNIDPNGYFANNYNITYVGDTLKIDQRLMHISFVGADSIVYGTPLVMSDYLSASLDLASSDSIAISLLGFGTDTSLSGNPVVGDHWLELGDSLIVNAAYTDVTSNYRLTIDTFTLNVRTRTLSVINAIAQNKIYDNTLEAVIDSANLDSVVLGDDILLISATTGQFADEDVAESIMVTPDSMSLGGSDRDNYRLVQPSSLLADIMKRPIVYTLDSVADKVYDGTDSLVNVIAAATTDTILVDSIILHYELSFTDEDADSNITIHADTWFITGLDTANYLLLPYHGDSADIKPKELIIKANDTTKIYDGIPFIGGNGIAWSGFVSGEDTSHLSGALSYVGASQGAIDTAYYSIEPNGYYANNYTIDFVADSLRINPRLLSINYGGADTLIYGDAINMFNYTPVTTDLAAADTFKMDSIGFGVDTSSSGQLIVGVHPLEIGNAYILNAAQDTVTHNYIFSFNPPSLWVNPKVLTVIGAVAEDKVYDKRTDAVISGAVLNGVEAGDSILLHQADHGVFSDDDVNSTIVVHPDSIFISGIDAANYVLVPLPLLQADILPRPVLYTIDTVSDKVYDATDTLLYHVAAVTSDTIFSDSIILSYDLSFSDKNAGIDMEITADVWQIFGAEVHNYQLLPYAGDTASIFAKSLDIIANDTVKMYDSYRFYGGHGITWNGFVGSEDTSDLMGNLHYLGSSQSALDTGNYEIIPSGFSATNYDINYITDTLRINPKPLHINYGGEDTLMYGVVVDMLNYTPIISDLAANDSFYVGALNFVGEASDGGYLTAGNHDLDIGEAYILNSGVDSVTRNYIFTFNPPSLWVTRKELTIINATAQDKVYDNTTYAVVNGALLSGVMPGDDISLSNSDEGIFADENVNNAVLISTDSMLLQGRDTANYILAAQPVLMANITPRSVTYVLDTVLDKIYDGTDSITHQVSAITSDTIFEDSISLDFVLSFEEKNAGDNWNINTDVWQLQGARKGNYTLLPFAGDNAAITKADLYFTVADTSRYYGQDNPSFSYAGLGYVAGEDSTVIDHLPSVSCVLNPKTFVGDYVDVIQLVGGSDNNYNFILDNADLRINKVRVDVNYMAEDTLTYGEVVDANDYSVAGGQMVNNDSLYLGALQFGNDTSSSGHLTIGAHTILPGDIMARDAAGLVNVSVNYEITFNPTFVVYEPKTVYAQIQTVDKEYDGDTESQLIFKSIANVYSTDEVGLDILSSDLLPLTNEQVLNAQFMDKAAENQKLVSPVSCHFLGADCHNYTILLPELRASIKPRKINWFGEAQDKVYDGKDNAVIDTVGLLRTLAADDINVRFDGASFEQADAGDNLSVSLTNLLTSGADKSNYELNPIYDLKASIHKAVLLAKLNDLTFIYGDKVPSSSFTFKGFVNGESATVVDELPSLTSDIASKFDVGYYTLFIADGKDNNYTMSYFPGQAQVLPRPLQISYTGPDELCENEPIDITAYNPENLASGDDLSLLEFAIAILDDDSLRSGKKYNIERGTTVIRNEGNVNVTDNYTIFMAPSQVEILTIPGPALGKNLEFCGVCEYDFDGGEGTSYLWSTGETTRHISMQGNYRGDVWVRVGNENGCFNVDTVDISVESKFLKDFIVAFIYPNPSEGQFKVELSHHVTDIAYIYDMTGNLLKKIEVDSDEFEVDINVPDGVYVLEILDAKELFIIENSELINYK